MVRIEVKFHHSLLHASDIEKSIAVQIAVKSFSEAIGFEIEKAKKVIPGNNPRKLISDLELQYYKGLWYRDKIQKRVIEYLKGKEIGSLKGKDFDKMKIFLSKEFAIPVATINELIIKSYLAGRISELAEKEIRINLATLPKTIREAIKKHQLTWEQVRYVKVAQVMAAENVVGISNSIQHRILLKVMAATMNKTSHEGLRQQLFREFNNKSMLNRDMERIAVSEMNAMSNAGFISGVPEGGYVVGISHSDACKWCLSNIQGKVLKVIDDPPPDYSNLAPKSKRYREIAKIWDNCIWDTKTNIGRSASKNKRIDDELIAREHDELLSPGILPHSSCRCRYVKFFSDSMYIKKGEIIYVSSDKEDKERLDWLKKNPHIKED